MSGNLPPGVTQRDIDYAQDPYGYYDDFDPSEDQYEDEPDPKTCDHDDYDADILTGRAHCHRCGHAWWMTSEEFDCEIARIRDYNAWERRQRFLEPFRRVAAWLRSLWPRRRKPADIDDEIPF